MTTDTVEVVAPVPGPTAETFEAAIANYDVATSDGPREEASAESKTEAKTDAPQGDAGKTADLPPAWVTWTEEGGFKVKPGKGFTIAEDGSVVFDPEVAQRMANKRVGRTREQERQAAQRRIEEVERKYQAEIEALKKGGGAQQEASGEKPWAVHGAAKPVLEDFDSVEQWADARDEWRDAQTRGPQKAEDVGRGDADRTDAGRAEPSPFDAAVKEMFEAGVAAFEDFDAVAGPVELNQAVLEATMASERAPELLYFYGKHPEVADELNDLEGYPLLVAIAKAEARMTAQAGPTAASGSRDDNTRTPGATPPRKEVTPVISPVRPGASPRRSLSELAADDDADGFYAHLAKELKE